LSLSDKFARHGMPGQKGVVLRGLGDHGRDRAGARRGAVDATGAHPADTFSFVSMLFNSDV
jgi:hypothetical protein